MQRISQKHKAADARRRTCDVRRHSAAHRLTTNDQPLRLVLGKHVLDNTSVPLLKLGLGIRDVAFRVHVVKIESGRQKPVFWKFVMKVSHERRLHALPSTVSEDDRRAVIPRGRTLDFKYQTR